MCLVLLSHSCHDVKCKWDRGRFWLNCSQIQGLSNHEVDWSQTLEWRWSLKGEIVKGLVCIHFERLLQNILCEFECFNLNRALSVFFSCNSCLLLAVTLSDHMGAAVEFEPDACWTGPAAVKIYLPLKNVWSIREKRNRNRNLFKILFKKIKNRKNRRK